MNEWWEDKGGSDQRGGLALGVLLIVLGGLFLVGNQFNFNWQHYGWPFFIIVPGLVLLVIGLAIPNEAGVGLTIPGGIVTTVGLILAFQESTDTYASWAYVWALVAPGSVGASLLLYGLLHRRLDLVDAGLRIAAVGLGLFIGFGLFFENIIGINEGHDTTVLRQGPPFLAVAMGAIIILLNLLPRPGRKQDAPASSDTWSGGAQPPAS
jgi:hypothetical protein